jgi:glycosyltransferase involved in cell wall biosynthesis
MKLAIDIRPMLESRRAGVSLYTANLVRALIDRHAFDHVLFLNALGRSIPADVPAASSDVRHAFSRYPNKLLNAAISFLGRPTIESLCGDVDAVYLPNLSFAATERPYAVTVHDLSFVRYPRYFSAKQRAWHAAIHPARLLARASRVIAVSSHTKTDITETFGVPSERIDVISPAVGPEFRRSDDAAIAEIRAKYGIGRRPFILYLGTLEPRKNVRRLIEAYGRIDADADLVIAGGRGWLDGDVFDAAASSPKRDRIRFLGYVDEQDKPALYSAASVFAYPSHYEGFGMPPLEAMACGTPVLASHASSLPEVVGDAGLLVDPHDLTALVDGLEAILTDARLRDAFRDAGPERATRFTWQQSAERLERTLRSLA